MHQRGEVDERDRDEIPLSIEIEPSKQRDVERQRDVVHDDGVTVGRRACDPGGCDIAGGAAHILDDDRLPELRRQHRPQPARDRVGASAGRERDDHGDGAVGIVLRPGDAAYEHMREHRHRDGEKKPELHKVLHP